MNMKQRKRIIKTMLKTLYEVFPDMSFIIIGRRGGIDEPLIAAQKHLFKTDVAWILDSAAHDFRKIHKLPRDGSTSTTTQPGEEK